MGYRVHQRPLRVWPSKPPWPRGQPRSEMQEMSHDRPVGKADHRNCALIGDEIPKRGDKASNLCQFLRFPATM